MSYYSDIQYKNRPYNLTDHLYFTRFFGEVKGPILDVGCNAGQFMLFSPHQMIGIDIDWDGLKTAALRRYRVGSMNVSQALAFKDSCFDAVHMRHVIEHLPNPLRALQECYRVLKPGGMIICSTPDIGHCGLNIFYSDYTHLRPFTKVSLSKIAYDAGFREHQILNRYIYVKGSKWLVNRGWSSIENILAIQDFLYKLGIKHKYEIILVGRK